MRGRPGGSDSGGSGLPHWVVRSADADPRLLWAAVLGFSIGVSEVISGAVNLVMLGEIPLRAAIVAFVAPAGIASMMLAIFVPVLRSLRTQLREHAAMAEALASSEARYRGLVEQTPDFIGVHADGRLLFANPAAARIAGAGRVEELVGRPVLDLVHPSCHDLVIRRTRAVVAGKPQPMAEEQLVRLDGGLVDVEVVSLPTTYEGKPAVLVVGRDVTQQKRMREELARSNRELELFASVASHDLQEPLRTVASFVQLLQRRYQGQLDATADEYIGFAVDGARRMQTLINDLLAFSRIGREPMRRVAVELTDSVGAALADLGCAIAESGAQIEHGPLPRVSADPMQMAQVFRNLIGNAVKYHRAGAPARVMIDATRRDDHWEIAVADDGIGIDPEYFELIFAAFRRLHPAEDYPGSGIGLAICKKVIEGHGGRIWVDSTPGQGSTFRFTLPATAQMP